MAKKKKEALKNFSFEHAFDDYVDDRVVIEDEPKKKKSFQDSPLGRILDAIKVTKNRDLFDDQEVKKAFEPFITLKFLSMNEDYCELVNIVNQMHGPMDKEMVFNLLLELIPKGKTYDKFLSTKREEADQDVINISEYYEISQREARTYVTIMGEEWANEISSRISNEFTSRRKPKRGKK